MAVLLLAGGGVAFALTNGSGTSTSDDAYEYGGPISLVTTVDSEPAEAWSNDEFDGDDRYVVALAGDGSRVFVVGGYIDEPDSFVAAIDRSSGETLWEADLDGWVDVFGPQPTVAGSTLVVATGPSGDEFDGVVSGLSVDDGDELWSEDLDGSALHLSGWPSLVERRGLVIVQSSGYEGLGETSETSEATDPVTVAVGLDPGDGSVQWSEKGDDVAFYDDRVYVLDGGSLTARTVSDGEKVWDVGVDEEDSSTVYANGSVVLVSEGDRVVAHSTSDGEELWNADVDDGVSSALPTSDTEIAVTDGDRTTIFDASGKEQWDSKGYLTFTRPAEGYGYLRDDEDLIAVSLDDGAELGSAEVDPGGDIGDPWATNAAVWISRRDLTTYDPGTLEEKWSARLDSDATALAVLDGAVVYATDDGEVILLR